MLRNSKLEAKTVSQLLDLQEQIESTISKETDEYTKQALISDLSRVEEVLEHHIAAEIVEDEDIRHFQEKTYAN